jgi:hypothetical protein
MLRLLKAVVQWPPLALLRLGLWLREASKDAQATRATAKRYGYQSLEEVDSVFSPGSGSDTLFILGSGSSVLNLTDEDFDLIRQHRSVGINMWALHPFVPDAYSLEYSKNDDFRSESWIQLEKALNREEVRTRNPLFLHLRPSGDPPVLKKYSLPAGTQNRSIMYGRLNLIRGSEKAAQEDLKLLMQAQRNGMLPRNVVPDNGASVVRLIFLAIREGFQNIVLVGVDLDSRPYFWLDQKFGPVSPEVMSAFPRPSGEPHSTLSTDERPYQNDVFIRLIAQLAPDFAGAKIFVGSKDSALASSLDVFAWNPAAPNIGAS